MFRIRPSLLSALVVLCALPILVAATRGTDDVPIAGLPEDEATPGAALAFVEPDGGVDITLVPVGEFEAPVEVFATPTGETLVVEVTGRIRTLSGAVVLDIADRILVSGEQGLLGAAMHPTESLLYAHYSNHNGDSVLAEFAVDPATGAADAQSHRVVMVIEQPFENHNGGEVAFGPDGLLYLGLGDGGLAGDPLRAALDLTSPLGKILRIDPLAAADAPYSIPADNPFAETADADARIWSFGLRNPWKFSFDAATGDLWIADVGQDFYEEINVARAVDGAGAGVSFGWSAFEAEAPFNADQPSTDHADPYLVTEHADGNCSISGGAVARDELVPTLDGWYVFGDYCTGVMTAVSTTDPTATITLGQVEALTAVAEGGDGTIYATSAAGTVYRLAAS